MLDSARIYLKNRFHSGVCGFIVRNVSGLRMRRIDSDAIPEAPDEIRLFLTARNESLRLPYFFEYYRSLGVDRFFVVDHTSTDDMQSLLLSQEDTHVFQTREHFRMKATWMNYLLNRYGIGHWCIVVDADELLAYPHYKTLDLRDLCEYFDQHGYTAMHCLLLDMYSDKPFRQTEYEKGSDPLLAAPYFDPDTHHKVPHTFDECEKPPEFRYFGGMRKRLFGAEPCLSKFPLIKFKPQVYLIDGQHTIRYASIADVEGLVFHTKFLYDFRKNVREQVELNQQWRNAVEYRKYEEGINKNPDISAYYHKSVRYADDRQLLELGLMKTSEKFNAFAEKSLREGG
jgi:hypothetical protein